MEVRADFEVHKDSGIRHAASLKLRKHFRVKTKVPKLHGSQTLIQANSRSNKALEIALEATRQLAEKQKLTRRRAGDMQSLAWPNK